MNKTITMREIGLLLSNRKDMKFNRKYNDVHSNQLDATSLLAKVQSLLKCTFKKEPSEETNSDIYSNGNIKISVSDFNGVATICFFEAKRL